MLTLSDNTVQVKNDLYELDCAILNHLNTLYYYDDLLHIEDFSIEGFGDKVKEWSKEAINFIVNLFNKVIAAATALFKFLKNIVTKVLKKLSDYTKRKSPEQNPTEQSSDRSQSNTEKVKKIAVAKCIVLDDWKKELDTYVSIGEDSIEVDNEEKSKDIDAYYNSVTEKFIKLYNKADASHATRKIELSTTRSLSEVLQLIEKLKKERQYCLKLASSKNARDTESLSGRHDVLSEGTHHHARYWIFYGDNAQEVVRKVLINTLKYIKAYQKAWSIWIKYARNVMVLINKAYGGTGEKPVFMQFGIPQDVRKELGEYFGKHHDQGMTIPLKASKLVVVSDNADFAHFNPTGKFVLIGLSIFLKPIDTIAPIILHELVHASQHNRHIVVNKKPGNIFETGNRKGTKKLSNRYHLEDPFGYVLGLSHDSEFIEKQADKVAAQFVHDVKSGKMSENCATYRWIKDMKSKVDAYVKKNNITHKTHMSDDEMNRNIDYINKRMETNRTTPLKLQEKKID